MMPWIYTAMIARVFFGFAVGIFSTIVPLFVIEISPIHLKGTNGSFIQLGVTSGILLAYLMGNTAQKYKAHDDDESYCGSYDGGGIYWRFILAFPFIPSLIQIILLIFVFKLDTPKYY